MNPFHRLLLLVSNIECLPRSQFGSAVLQIKEAKVFGASPLLAGDSETPVDERGLDPGAILGDPEHVFSALIRNVSALCRLLHSVRNFRVTLLTIVCRLQVFFEFEEHLPQAQKTQLGELFEQHVRPNTCYKNHVDGRDWRCVRHRSFCLVVLPVCQLPCTTESRNVL